MSLNHDGQLPAPTLAFPVSEPKRDFRRPSPVALAAAANVAKRNYGRTTPLRRLFAERADTAPGSITPLAQMLRGGRGGSVRLRLYLAYLWLAAAEPHELSYPSRAWAELLDLDDPSGSGARRIADAVRWLERHRFIEVENRAGAPNLVRLLSDAGDGGPYELPGKMYSLMHRKPAAKAHRYIQLPPELWTSGWMAILSPAALAMLIVLMVHLGTNDAATTDLWIAPDYATATYLLAEETRTRGVRELRDAGLITIRRRQLVANDSFDFRRFRNVYRLNVSNFASPAAIPTRRVTPQQST